MTQHSHLGASKASRWLNCPGSVILSRTVPEPPPSKYAELGSCAHWVAEQCLRDGKPALAYLGAVCPEYPTVEIDADMTDAVQVYVEHCRSLELDDKGNRIADVETHLEHKFWLCDVDFNLFGTADWVVYDPVLRRLHVADYKHGAGVYVDVYENDQLSYYALGAMELYPNLVERVTLHIVQPRAPGRAVKTWATPRGYMARFETRLRDGLARVYAEDDTLKAGDWCRFCPAKAICPAHGDGEVRTRGRAADEFQTDGLDFSALD